MTERKLALVVKNPKGEKINPLQLLAETRLNASIRIPAVQTITRVGEDGKHHTENSDDKKFGIIVEFPKQEAIQHALAERELKIHLATKKFDVVRAKHTENKGRSNFTKVVRRRM